MRLGSLMVSALDSRRHGCDSRPPLPLLGWVTFFGQANHLIISPSHPGQLGVLPSAGRERSTSQKCGDALTHRHTDGHDQYTFCLGYALHEM